MSTFRFIKLLLSACCLPPLLAGCIGGSSPPSRFYTLAPLAVPAVPAVPAPDILLTVGPVDLPEYLNRKQIVTRSGQNELVVAEFNRWGGSLDSEITTALVTQLADRLSSGRFAVFSWKSVPGFPAKAIYRVPVSIDRFDGILGESVVLHGRWEVLASMDVGGVPLLVKETTVTEKADGKSYEAQVAAMQRALGRFGKEMADSIATAKVP